MAQVGATLHRLEALDSAVELKASKGQMAHIWLSAGEVRHIMMQPLGRMARRDKVVMALLLGAGLRYGKAIGKSDLAPHDTRRTYYAQLGNEAGVNIAKLSCLLGHSSVSVMQRYLNL